MEGFSLNTDINFEDCEEFTIDTTGYYANRSEALEFFMKKVHLPFDIEVNVK